LSQACRPPPVVPVTTHTANSLFAGQVSKIIDAGKQLKSASDFELITWLVIK
jgi:hypothetical protein